MSDSTFVAKLVDDISGPAARAAGGVRRITDAFGKVQDVAVSADGKVRNLRGQFVKLAPAGKKVSNIFTKIGDAMKSMGGQFAVGQLVASGIQAIASAALEAVRAVGRLALEFGKAVAQGAAFAEGLQFGLSKFLGSASKARGAIKQIMAISNALGLNFQEAGSQFQAFISAGFNELQALNLLRFKADIIAVGDGGEASAEKIKEAFVQIEKAMAKGKIEADGFDSILGSLPVTKVQVLTILAKKMGKTFKEVSELDITQLPVEKLIEAFQEAALQATKFEKTGALAAEKIKTTFSGAAAALKNRLINQLTILGSKIGPQISSTLLPVLQRMLAFLDSAAFEKFTSAFGKSLATGATAAAKAIDDMMTSLESGTETATGFLEGLNEGFEGVNDIVGPVNEVLEAFGAESGGGASAAKLFGMALGALVAVIMILGKIVETVFLAPFREFLKVWDQLAALDAPDFGAIFSAAGAAITAFVSSAGSLAGRIITGWVASIKAGASKVVSAITGVAKRAIAAAKSALGVASDSKVFTQIGGFTASGMQHGIEAGAPKVSAAAAGLIRPTAPSASAASNTTSVSAPVSISVNAADDPEATAAAIKRMMVGELADMFEQINISVSAA